MLCSQFNSRTGYAGLRINHGDESYKDVAISNWMGASPVYTQRMQKAMGFAGGTDVACRRGDGDYFWAPDSVRTRLSKAPVLWRSKKVADFDRQRAVSLHLKKKSDEVLIEKEDPQTSWRLPDGTEADQARVFDRVNALSKLEATDYDLMAPMTGEMGIAEIFFTANGEGSGKEPIAFTFYSPLGEGGRAMVRVSGRDTLMGVDPAAVASVFADFDDLRPTSEIVEDSVGE